MKSFLDLSVKKIIAGYGNGTVSPEDVAGVCVSQYERLEPKVDAWEVFGREKILSDAKASTSRIRSGEPMRPLEGIPVGIKDIFNTRDYATEMGSPLWKGFTPGNDARVVYYLKQAGASIAGKTVTAEFAVHTLGKTKNPHDPRHNPGTSSSGSAVAVAVGMVPVAIGTQTAGSIVRPASFSGVYGCKPSFGLIPRTGSLKTTDSLDTVGFFATHYEDLETVFEVLRVHGPDYPLSDAPLSDPGRQAKPKGRKWKIAFVKTHTWKDAHPYAQKAIEDYASRLSEDEEIEVIEAGLPGLVSKAHDVHSRIYDKTLSYYFKEEYKKKELVSPIMNEIIERGNAYSIKEYQSALHEQEDLALEMDEFLSSYDALISLSTAGEAPLREERERPDPALIWTLTHLPVVSAPVFVSPKGLPYGLQIAARRYDDYKLFRFCDYLRSKNYIPEGPNPKAKII